MSEGLVYWETELPDGTKIPYWDESNYYEFNLDEIELFEDTSVELHTMARETAEYLASGTDFTARQLGLPEGSLEVLRDDLARNPFSLYGRFDFAFNAMTGDLKMLEYNADTPTGIVEMGVQWNWLEDKFPNTDQCNSLYDRFTRQWGRGKFRGNTIYFGYCGAATRKTE
jgi:glutathionylspermidine synthase